MKSTVIILAIVGAALCQGGFGGPGGPGGQKGPGGKGGSEGRGERGSGGRGGKGHHPHTPPLLPFLHNVTDDARKEYFDIMRNENLTVAQQKVKINEWGDKYKVLDQVKEFDKNLTKLKNEVKQNVTKLIGQLSEALVNMSAIVDNENQTTKEMYSAIHNLTKQNPPLYHVLQYANNQFMYPCGHCHGKGKKDGARGPGERPPFGGPEGPEGHFGGNNQGFGGFGQGMGGGPDGMGGGPTGMGGRGGMGGPGMGGGPSGMGGQGGMGFPGGMNGFQGGQNQFGRNNGLRV
ncbi:hypothetical protein OESDEN_20939 [Oesophagostomum dentatum]|uniref:SXP/RAL-2 family protein Ani s 5-like cation-binding domain-containing protein n=1 Tax=Oesophagostomum dentatum TaxID=61180 RepID=A0A0B1S850_OESDE|nr:hypothetical protein OESDEN_20939 [Oesophagostomum dentatum]